MSRSELIYIGTKDSIDQVRDTMSAILEAAPMDAPMREIYFPFDTSGRVWLQVDEYEPYDYDSPEVAASRFLVIIKDTRVNQDGPQTQTDTAYRIYNLLANGTKWSLVLGLNEGEDEVAYRPGTET
ncbi:hypothetical protein [Rhizohabitans arisaemae]|uniref:hypothetical protein n=1 Tax=Rhizohabitans arisaemae TaxID=2720610 RepID=UPI0024B0D0DE|nr:hypothetical protein [Rhizohabitans arisaemae]